MRARGVSYQISEGVSNEQIKPLLLNKLPRQFCTDEITKVHVGLGLTW